MKIIRSPTGPRKPRGRDIYIYMSHRDSQSERSWSEELKSWALIIKKKPKEKTQRSEWLMSIKLVCCALCGIGGTWCRDTDTHVVVRAIWLDWSRRLRLHPRCGPPTPAPVYPDSPRPTWVGWPAGCPTPGPSSPRSSAAQDDKTHSQDGDGSGGGGCHGNRTSHHPGGGGGVRERGGGARRRPPRSLLELQQAGIEAGPEYPRQEPLTWGQL